ncbi:MAG: hypothetical protein JWP97_5763 [Labilithrix sp.]|nr:hypothetical protein [Labilithrix sp.]
MADLSELIAEIESLGAAPEEIAKEAAQDALAALKAKTAAGLDIEGNAFAPKKDGTSYKDVSEALSVAVSGSSFVITLRSESNGAFFQNRMMGHRDDRPKRQILPTTADGPEPKEALEAIERAIERVRARKLGG